MVKHAVIALALVGCGSFEDPDIVIDFRVLAMSASVPEQVVDIDITNPAPPPNLLDQLVPTDVCALLSDRNFERRIRWSMTLCNLNSDERCPDGGPKTVIGAGLWDDPEGDDKDMAGAPPTFCATVPVDGNLLGVILDSLDSDQFKGLGGVYYGVSLVVGGEDGDPDLDLYAAKSLRVQPRIPPELQANNNPSLAGVDVRLAEDQEFQPLTLKRCEDLDNAGIEPPVVAPRQKIRFMPIEPDGVREEYVVPTIDGMSRMFTESPTYQFLASAGGFSAGSTGGPRDPFGNPAPLFTDWTAPAAKDLKGPTDVSFWFVQRDERLGLAWYEACVRVVP
ncbi:MAG TPA: hypothetical protein VFV99_01635 [Kofleriaceae bacterium]|nr:hypothetical protein [Kofleriaceae bacterium]